MLGFYPTGRTTIDVSALGRPLVHLYDSMSDDALLALAHGRGGV